MINDNAFIRTWDGMTLIEYYLYLEEKICKASKYKFGHFIEVLRRYLLSEDQREPDSKAPFSLSVIRKNHVERDSNAKYPDILHQKVKIKKVKFLKFIEKQLPDNKDIDLTAVNQELEGKLSDKQDDTLKGIFAFKLYFGNFNRSIWEVRKSFPKLPILQDPISLSMVPGPNMKMNGNFQWCSLNNMLNCSFSIEQIKLKTIKYCVILS